jgi:hypothetical protein
MDINALASVFAIVLSVSAEAGQFVGVPAPESLP